MIADYEAVIVELRPIVPAQLCNTFPPEPPDILKAELKTIGTSSALSTSACARQSEWPTRFCKHGMVSKSRCAPDDDAELMSLQMKTIYWDPNIWAPTSCVVPCTLTLNGKLPGRCSCNEDTSQLNLALEGISPQERRSSHYAYCAVCRTTLSCTNVYLQQSSM